MEVLLSTGSLYTLPLEEIFEMASSAGFDGIELLISPGFSKRHPLDQLKELSAILPIRALHAPFIRFRHWRGKISSLRKSVEWARQLGAQVVTFHPPNWLNLEFRFWQWMKGIRDFQREVGDGDVAVSIENMPLVGLNIRFCGYFWSSTRKLLRFAEEKNLFLTFDCTHMGTRRIDFIEEFLLFYRSGRVKNIHFSDYRPFHEHLYPGKGHLPLTRFLHLLGRIGYGEFLTVEITPQELPEDREKQLEALQSLLEYIKASIL